MTALLHRRRTASSVGPAAVFNTLWKFIEELRKVWGDYRLAQERAAAQARKAAAEAETKAKKAAAAAARAGKGGR